MKMKSLSLAGLAATVASLACAQPAVQFKVPGETAPAAAAPGAKFTNEQLTEEFGWWIAKRIALTEVQFTPAEREALIKGFRAALSGGEAPYDLEKAGPAMDQLMSGKQSTALQGIKSKNQGDGASYFETLKSNHNVTFTPSGLAYEIVQPGSGPFPGPTDTVKVNYTGKLINGTVFDSSVQRGTPAEFALNQVIPGWTEGIQKVNKGGKIRLYIPANLGYGDAGQQGIPPASTLIFDVELLDIKPAAPAAPGGLSAHP